MLLRDHTFLGMTQSLCPECLALVPAKIIARDDGRVSLFDVSDWTKPAPIRVSFPVPSGPVTGLAFLPDGRLASSSNVSQALIWDVSEFPDAFEAE